MLSLMISLNKQQRSPSCCFFVLCLLFCFLLFPLSFELQVEVFCVVVEVVLAAAVAVDDILSLVFLISFLFP